MTTIKLPFTATGEIELDLGGIVTPPPVEPPPVDPDYPPVTNLHVTDITSDSATLRWDYDGTASFFQLTGVAGSDPITVPIPAFRSSQPLTSLPSDTTITLSLKVLYDGGESAPATTIFVTDERTTPPPHVGDSDIERIVELGGKHWDFEKGANGTPIEMVEPEINGATDGTISTEQAHTGTRCFKTFIMPGQGGFGSYGGITGEKGDKPPRMKRGGEVWIRWWSFHPESWENECDPYMKHMRLETCKKNGDNSGGYSDMYLNTHQHRWISESEDSGWTTASSIFNLKKGRWQCYELYTKLDSEAADRGGMGRAVFWVNGIRAIDTGHSRTMRDSDGYSRRVLWKTWHQHNDGEGGGATEKRDSYIDDWTYAYRGESMDHGYIDCTPAMEQEGDLPMIGMST